MRIAITPGEPAGIGPELIVRAAHAGIEDIPPQTELVIVASKELLRDTATALKLDIELLEFDEGSFRPHTPGRITVLDIPLSAPCNPGQLNSDNGQYVLDTLSAAADGCMSGQFKALVTGPVHKGVINEAGHPFSGHTEFFAEHANCDKVVMMLATEGLRVALATTHLPLKDVAAAINHQELSQVITILHRDLQVQFGIDKPNILVCGLNPHAGEGGHMGREEIDTIIPTLNTLREKGITLEGPLPADTLFTPKYLDTADAVLAMYHDQGLPVLKYKGFGTAVNITLGLPYIRTSVDHGTALDIVHQGLADIGSLQTALCYAGKMATHQDGPSTR